MTIEETLKQLEIFSVRTEKEILQLISTFDAEIVSIQQELLLSLLSDFVGGLSFTGGKLDRTIKNFNHVTKFDIWFAGFRKLFLENQIVDFGNKLLEYAVETGNYYKALGFPADTIDAIAVKNGLLEARLGIKDGRLIKGGYLDSLANTDQVKSDLKNIVLNAVNSNTPLSNFTRTLRDYVKGSKDINGALQRYYDQYAYDSFNQVREIKNSDFSDKLGLKWFIYQGSVIATTRKFCSDRAGKVFHVSEVAKWKDDPNLINPKTKGQYNPLIDRGRYRCRHHIQYITEKLAQRLDPEKVKKINEQ